MRLWKRRFFSTKIVFRGYGDNLMGKSEILICSNHKAKRKGPDPIFNVLRIRIQGTQGRKYSIIDCSFYLIILEYMNNFYVRVAWIQDLDLDLVLSWTGIEGLDRVNLKQTGSEALLVLYISVPFLQLLTSNTASTSTRVFQKSQISRIVPVITGCKLVAPTSLSPGVKVSLSPAAKALNTACVNQNGGGGGGVE